MVRLHVVSWNILAPVYMKCKYYNSTTCSNLSIRKRRPLIHQTLNLLNADVYLFQEVTQTEYKHLQSRFPHYHWFFQAHAFHYWKESSSHESNGNAIALRKSLRIRNLQAHSLRLSTGNRGIMVTGQWHRRPWAWVSVHLDDTSDHCRQLQIDRLMDHISPDSVLVVGGDLNDENGTLISQFKKAHFFTSPSVPTYFEENPLALDYLLVRNISSHPFWYIPRSERTTIVNRFGSDHLPVTGVIDV